MRCCLPGLVRGGLTAGMDGGDEGAGRNPEGAGGGESRATVRRDVVVLVYASCGIRMGKGLLESLKLAGAKPATYLPGGTHPEEHERTPRRLRSR